MPVHDLLHQELPKREVLHADETTLQVLHKPGKTAQSKRYMWLYRTGGDTGRPIVLYEYRPGRGACHPKTFLAGFKGNLHTDRYAGYHSLPEEITVVGCWAHAKRKCDEAMKSLPKRKAGNSSAHQGLAYCNLLFRIEEGFAARFPKERCDQRLRQATGIFPSVALPGCARHFSKSCPSSSGTHPPTNLYSNSLTAKDRRASTITST